MFSLPKLLVTGLAIVGAWYLFKLIARKGGEDGDGNGRLGGRGRGTEVPPAGEVEDMVQCDACGDFVTRAQRHCGRRDCPFPK